ncbi:hypothetical protein BB558_003292 [Smittium angustum]|uniref:Uncharacterized protein n=1 Tax=Smittium angustum TaxID=133377 RepID=A0A2U1J6E8_SMIAN|nr:hypothetical protein BB558_003292 [Smittium angustum]
MSSESTSSDKTETNLSSNKLVSYSKDKNVSSPDKKTAHELRVLKEEQFIDKLDEIVEKSFFPTLTDLKQKNLQLSSLDEQNLIRLNTDSVEIPSFEKSGNVSTENSSTLLNDFLDTFTSEDNARYPLPSIIYFYIYYIPLIHFYLINNESAARKRKYHWMYDREKASNETKLIKNEEFHESTKSTIQTWRFKADNALMFSPESDNTGIKGNPRADTKKVVYENTRFQKGHGLADEKKSLFHQGFGSISESEGQSSKKGYSLVESPEHESIGSTSQSVVIHTPASVYKIPPTPLREAIAHKLASKETKIKANPDRSRISDNSCRLQGGCY